MVSLARRRTNGCRRGFSLLEVLVAMGILVTGLASVAALLPAAGSRLAEATAIDRAGTLSANAQADLVNRRVHSSDLFRLGPMEAAPSTKRQFVTGTAVAFGEVLRGIGRPPATAIPSTGVVTITTATTAINRTILTGTTPVAIAPEFDTIMRQRIDVSQASNDFASQDDLVYGGSTASGLVNLFEGTLRQFRRRICYGAMLTPINFASQAGSGSAARLSIAVFAKPTATFGVMMLVPVGSGTKLFRIAPVDASDPFKIPLTTRLLNEELQQQYLKSCSWVLAIPPNSTTGPRWFRVAASWSTSGVNPATGTTEVSESIASFDSDEIGSFPLHAGSLMAIGFDNLLRLDEQIVVLE